MNAHADQLYFYVLLPHLTITPVHNCTIGVLAGLRNLRTVSCVASCSEGHEKCEGPRRVRRSAK